MKNIKRFFLATLLLCISSCTQATTKKNNTHKANSEVIELTSDFIQEKINDNLYILKSKSYNTNIGVFIGKEDLLLIDPMAGNNKHQDLLATIKQISKKPIKYVLNTHNHLDHSGANPFFKNLGATIISQENVKYTNAKYGTTFNDSYSIDMGNETIELHHHTAHTFNDALIYFTKSNTVFMGDTYMTNSFPHFYYGGGSKGHLDILDNALALGNEKTIIVPSHGNLTSNKKELIEYKQNTILWSNRIKELHDSGKTVSSISQDEKIKALSATFNGVNATSRQRLVQTIEKTIAVDLVKGVVLSEAILKNFEGSYTYENGYVDELVLLNGILFLRREGAYIYELLPLSKTKFHIKGQVPYKHLTMNSSGNGFVYFNGKKNLIANK